MAVTEAAITAAGALTAAGISGAAQSSMNKKTREFNREEAEKQRAWSEKMFNEQNAWNYERWLEENRYNTPENQVARLRDAGLNPLFYGLDGSSAGDISAASPLGYERATADNQVNPVSTGIDSALKIAQLTNIQANTAKTKNENLTETQRREKLLADIDNAKQELNNLKASEGLTKSQMEEIDKRVSWLDRLNEATIAEKESAAKLNDSQRHRIEELLENEKVLQVKNIDDFEMKWKKVRAEIAKMAKETNILDKDIENYALNHANNGFMGTGLSFTNMLRGFKDRSNNPPKRDIPDDVQQLINEGQ